MTDNQVLLVGAGPMAVAYAKVLAAHGVTPVAVGRGAGSAAAFRAETGFEASEGGLDDWLVCAGLASVVLWATELKKVVARQLLG